MSIAGAGAIIVILLTRHRYITQKHIPAATDTLSGFEKLIYNKFYVDEIYEKIISKPVFKLSEWFGSIIDKKVVDRTVNATAKIVGLGGKTLRLFQSGNTGFYVFGMVVGMILLFIIRLFI